MFKFEHRQTSEIINRYVPIRDMSVDVQTTVHYMTQEGPGELKIEGIETMRGLVVIPSY